VAFDDEVVGDEGERRAIGDRAGKPHLLLALVDAEAQGVLDRALDHLARDPLRVPEFPRQEPVDQLHVEPRRVGADHIGAVPPLSDVGRTGAAPALHHVLSLSRRCARPGSKSLLGALAPPGWPSRGLAERRRADPAANAIQKAVRSAMAMTVLRSKAPPAATCPPNSAKTMAVAVASVPRAPSGAAGARALADVAPRRALRGGGPGLPAGARPRAAQPQLSRAPLAGARHRRAMAGISSSTGRRPQPPRARASSTDGSRRSSRKKADSSARPVRPPLR
jgi:hypothetical protein